MRWLLLLLFRFVCWCCGWVCFGMMVLLVLLCMRERLLCSDVMRMRMVLFMSMMRNWLVR